MKRSVWASLAVVGFFILTADTCNVSGGTPAGETSTPGGTITGAVGQVLTDSNGESVTVISFNAKATDPSGFETVSPGDECVGVSVTVKNGSSQEWLLPLDELSIVDASGQKFDQTSGLGICLTSTNIDSLVAGGHGSGSVYFEVPKAGALDVNWTPEDLSGQVFQVPVS